MKTLNLKAILGILFMFFGTICAAMEFPIATGPSGGVYTLMFNDMTKVSPRSELVEVPTTGAPQNLDFCISQKVMACMVNADQLWAKRNFDKEEAVDVIKTIFPLYDNSITMLSMSPSILNFSDLKGKKVGTFGGAAESLRIMIGLSKVQPAQIVNYDKFAQLAQQTMVNDFLAGKLDAIVGIGGGEIPWVKKITKEGVHLIAFDRWDAVEFLSVQKGYFYKLKTIKYPNLDGSVQTLSVRTILASARNWPANAPETKQVQMLFADLSNNLANLKLGAGKEYSLQWLGVSSMSDPTWPWYGHLKPVAAKK